MMGKLKLKPPAFKWAPFSNKQLKVLTWWMPESPHHDKDAIICDGSVPGRQDGLYVILL
ncbi:hypothetical protein D3C78_1604720 [compost metagenome]